MTLCDWLLWTSKRIIKLETKENLQSVTYLVWHTGCQCVLMCMGLSRKCCRGCFGGLMAKRHIKMASSNYITSFSNTESDMRIKCWNRLPKCRTKCLWKAVFKRSQFTSTFSHTQQELTRGQCLTQIWVILKETSSKLNHMSLWGTVIPLKHLETLLKVLEF